MNRGLSIYLDLFRVTAAFVVIVYHVTSPVLGGSWLRPPFSLPFGPDAVIGFFVLSGYVIAFVASTKENEPLSYASARLSRLWSVLLPALLLTLVFDGNVGRYIGPTHYEAYVPTYFYEHPFAALGTAAIFWNELWFLSIPPLSDAQVWSLGYEAWYYIIFGCIVFFTKKTGVLLAGISSLVAGPRILILLPVWALGVLLYHTTPKLKFPQVQVGLMLMFPSLSPYLDSSAPFPACAGSPSISADAEVFLHRCLAVHSWYTNKHSFNWSYFTTRRYELHTL